ncbi:protein of unknown function (plasmid) [Candidatus Methylocalor cossyra]|uniref:Uncharacterized protein n=1 Tax=Candidatus Methylocalor cossyra TaxID=3108543 RepID=A0ABM9NMX1_9GAMM
MTGFRINSTTITTGYPGHNCPGLIEAWFGWSKSGIGLVGYPGHNCPGLIEARLFRFSSEVSSISGYPGHNCPGLIEAWVSVPTKDFSVRYPGHNCPGLIEAH